MQPTTVAAPFVRNMLEGAAERGFDIGRLLRDNGISPAILAQPGSRVTVEQLSRLHLALIRLMGDEAFGLLGRTQRPGTFKLACYAAIHARNVGEALSLIAQFSNIAGTGLTHRIVDDHGTIRYELARRPGVQIRHHGIEHLLVIQHRTLGWLADAPIPVLKVELDYAPPAYRDEYRYLFYGTPVDFSAAVCALTFSGQSMRLENVRDIVALRAFLGHAPLTLLTQTTAPVRLSAQVRAWLDRSLLRRRSAPSLDEAADHFRRHPQALRRHLGREGTSYQQIKMESRRDLSIALLHDTTLSVADVAARLDYSEPRAFIRAFRGWTGMTPLAYRKLTA